MSGRKKDDNPPNVMIDTNTVWGCFLKKFIIETVKQDVKHSKDRIKKNPKRENEERRLSISLKYCSEGMLGLVSKSWVFFRCRDDISSILNAIQVAVIKKSAAKKFRIHFVEDNIVIIFLWDLSASVMLDKLLSSVGLGIRMGSSVLAGNSIEGG